MTDDDPNEAYEVVPIEPGPHGPPHTWWTVKRNGLFRMHPNVRRGLPLFERDRDRQGPSINAGFPKVQLNLRLTAMTHV